jgi:hypothetical protein
MTFTWRKSKFWQLGIGVLISTFLTDAIALADCRTQAVAIFQNLTGTLPPSEVKEVMSQFTCSGNYAEAANTAINYKDRFYKKFNADWYRLTNKSRVDRGIFNSALALWMCMIRDEIPFNQVLSGDLACIGDPGEKGDALPPVSLATNDHYKIFEERGLSFKDDLKLVKQTEIAAYTKNGFSPETVAGVLTTQQWGQQYFIAGTNRAVLAFSYDTFLCKTIDELLDNTLPKDIILGAVERAPAGDPSTFINKCSGCHAIMDAHLGATAYYDFIDTPQAGLIFNPATKQPANDLPQVHKDWFAKLPAEAKKVAEKINRNGFLSELDGAPNMTDDHWTNPMANLLGKNSRLGWNGRQSGKGLQSWGKMITSSDQFSKCMAQRVYQATCNVSDKTVIDDHSQERISQLASLFSAGNYNMKKLFGQAAVSCKGD